MLLCYITDRRQFRGSEAEQRRALLDKISQAARCGVDYIQLREKDLSARELLRLAQEARQKITEAQQKTAKAARPALTTHNSPRATRLLINSRLDIALAAGADGVHLRGDDISAAEVRVVIAKVMPAASGKPGTGSFVIACSCHTVEDVRRAQSDTADFVVFGPVFGKGEAKGVGLDALRFACREVAPAETPEPSPAVRIPVLALGGVTLENARSCLDAGAAGIAGIRLFQESDIARVVAHLRRPRKQDARDAK